MGVNWANNKLLRTTFGYCDVDKQDKVTPEALFPVASVSKTVASFAIALLVDEGVIGLDDPIVSAISEFQMADEYSTNNMTLRDILSHRLGMPRYTLTCHGVDISLDEYVKKLRYMPLKSSFRSGYSYSNALYIVVGYIIEKLTGNSWRQFVKSKIFDPLSMHNSYYLPVPDERTAAMAKGYIRRNNQVGNPTLEKAEKIPSTDLSPGMAGGLVSNLEDMLTWLSVHVDAYQGKSAILGHDKVIQLHQPQVSVPTNKFRTALHGDVIDTYALGWRVESYNGSKIISHGGIIEGYRSIIGFIPDQEISVAVLSNTMGSNAADIVFYQAMDLASGVSGRDRNNEFKLVLDNWKKDSHQETRQLKIEPPVTAHEHLVGSYKHEAYPNFEIKLINKKLQGRLGEQCAWGEILEVGNNLYHWYYKAFHCYFNVKLRYKDEAIDLLLELESEIDMMSFAKMN